MEQNGGPGVQFAFCVDISCLDDYVKNNEQNRENPVRGLRGSHIDTSARFILPQFPIMGFELSLLFSNIREVGPFFGGIALFGSCDQPSSAGLP
jgi:hypothetical protein